MGVTAESLDIQLSQKDEIPNKHLDVLLTKEEIVNVIGNLYLDKCINDDALWNLSTLAYDRINAEGELNLGYMTVKFFLREL